MTPGKTLLDHLAGYAAYHRDARNIQTHFVGIPMIVFAVTGLLSRPVVALGGLPVSPAWVAAALVALFYLRLDLRFGLAMAAVLAAACAFGAWAAGQATGTWVALCVGLFVVGWVLQFVGHYYEGRKPAFVDDISGLIVGPLFVAAEVAFLCGLRPELQAAIEARSGPVHGHRAATH